MFYGAIVLSKKGPLAKVWLAAHWDKKLTKAHVFETDVGSTVESIISPQIKLALRTSGHLLLGVVRIYSRKQKYLLHDLGEACAKIKMAFRPGIVDLPRDNGAENADAITLPEIFHDFESAVADLGALDLKAQFTINPSRASEITMAEDPTTTTGSGDLFGGEFDGYDLKGGEFEGGMEDIEVPRNTEGAEFGDANEVSHKNGSIESRDFTKGTISLEEPALKMNDDIPVDERLPDAANDFGGGGGFLGEDGFGGEFGDFPSVPDLGVMDPSKDEEMEVDPPQQKTPEPPPPQPPLALESEQPPTEEAPVAAQEEEGFVLEPVEVEEKRGVRRKRRLVVDTDKEFTGQQIKAQFDDFKDLLQAKCFPPPTKKAMLWKEMAGCDQLFSNPTIPLLGTELFTMITRNYCMDVSGKAAVETGIELDNIVDASRDTIVDASRDNITDANNVSKDTSAIEKVRGAPASADLEPVGAILPERDDALLAVDELKEDAKVTDLEGTLVGGDDLRPFDVDNGLGMGMEEDFGLGATNPIPDMGDFDDILPTPSTEEQQSNELSEEFEERRWTKRTQQVLRVLQHNLLNSDQIEFSSLTRKCNRKQAASRFYTCLLLAKEGMITVEQPQPYGDIRLQKGPKFTE